MDFDFWSSKCKIRFHPFSEAAQSFIGISSHQTGPSQIQWRQIIKQFAQISTLQIFFTTVTYVQEKKNYGIFISLNPLNSTKPLQKIIAFS